MRTIQRINVATTAAEMRRQSRAGGETALTSVFLMVSLISSERLGLGRPPHAADRVRLSPSATAPLRDARSLKRFRTAFCRRCERAESRTPGDDHAYAEAEIPIASDKGN
jgi:hypothetical protein